MSLNNNIEELFKSKLESFEAPVNDAMWSNISSSLGTTTTAATTGSVISKLFSTTGIAVGTGIICTVVTVLVMSSQNESTTIAENETMIVVETPIVEADQIVVNDDEIAVNNIVKNVPVESNDPSVKADKAESFIIIPSSNNSTKEVGESQESRPTSAVYSFLTPRNKINTEANVEETAVEKETVKEKEKEITIIETQEDELIATIIASPVGGYAPLDVYFSNPATHGSVHWDFGDGTSSEDFSPSHTFEKYGSYTVELTITDENGKERKDYRVIDVIANSAITVLPNVFTPNGDGINDFCTVKGKNLDTFQMKVFNRSGDVIFETESIDRPWDGKSKFGEDISKGTYFYLISARGIDGKVYEHTGTITLSR